MIKLLLGISVGLNVALALRHHSIETIVASDRTAINEYACNTVVAWDQTGGGGGCYDICLKHSRGIYKFKGVSSGMVDYRGDFKNYWPVYLDSSYPHDIQNACAVVMNGGDY